MKGCEEVAVTPPPLKVASPEDQVLEMKIVGVVIKVLLRGSACRMEMRGKARPHGRSKTGRGIILSGHDPKGTEDQKVKKETGTKQKELRCRVEFCSLVEMWFLFPTGTREGSDQT